METTSAAKLQSAVQSSGVGLLATLKASLGLGDAQKGLFANLLADSDKTLPEIKAAEPRAAAPRSAPEQDVSDDGVRPVAQEAAHPVSGRETDRSNQSVERKAEKTKADGAKQAQKADDADRDTKEASADSADKTQNSEAQETDNTSKVSQETVGRAEEKEEVTSEDERMMELLAALCPLDETVQTTGAAETEGKIDETDKAQTDPASLIEEEMKALAAEQREQLQAQNVAEQKEGPHEKKKIKEVISNALNVKAEHRVTQENASELQSSATDDVSKAVETKAEKTEKTIVDAPFGQGVAKGEKGAGQNGTLSSGGQHPSTQDNYFDRTYATPAQGLTHSEAPQNAAPTSAVQDILKVQESTSAATAGAKTQTTLPVAEGVRSSSSYDFASQLSALRSAKGGSTGLPQAVEQVSVQIHKMVKEGTDSITIQLKPVELGKIEVKLEISSDNKVQGTVVVENQATLNLLSKDVGSLQRALQDAGLQADPGSLQFSLKGDGQNQNMAQGQNGGGAQTTTFGFFEDDDEMSSSLAASSLEASYVLPGRVNLRV